MRFRRCGIIQIAATGAASRTTFVAISSAPLPCEPASHQLAEKAGGLRNGATTSGSSDDQRLPVAARITQGNTRPTPIISIAAAYAARAERGVGRQNQSRAVTASPEARSR